VLLLAVVTALKPAIGGAILTVVLVVLGVVLLVTSRSSE
jgi:hypothetical protein